MKKLVLIGVFLISTQSTTATQKINLASSDENFPQLDRGELAKSDHYIEQMIAQKAEYNEQRMYRKMEINFFNNAMWALGISFVLILWHTGG